MDGHGSHFTLELLQYCRQIGLHVYLRPPHTTHILQGEDVVHFREFKGAYHQAKMVKLGQKVLRGVCKLTVGDLLDVARAPWEAAFSQANTLKAWAEIGVSPFTRCVYWDLVAAQQKKEKVAASAGINPDLLDISKMVGIMFGVDPSQGPLAGKKRDRDTLYSSDLWDLPGGATGDDCFERVKKKTDERNAKEKEKTDRKNQAAKKRQQRQQNANDLGGRIISALKHEGQIAKLLVVQLKAALAFRAVTAPQAARKDDLVRLLKDNLQLPSTGDIPPLQIEEPEHGEDEVVGGEGEGWGTAADDGEAQSDDEEAAESDEDLVDD